jgi:PAS domain S-box-containing protein
MTPANHWRTFTIAAQYLARLTADQQIWDEAGKVLINFFGADLVAFGVRSSGGPVTVGNWTRSEWGSRQDFSEAGLIGAMEEVFDNSFLTFAPLPTPDPAVGTFFPVLHENKVAAVMFVGLAGGSSPGKEILELYLAVAGLVGVTYSRTLSELAVLQAKDGWERTFESVSDHIALIDLDFRIVRANRALAECRGVTPEALIGLSCHRALHRDNYPHQDCPFRDMMAKGKEHRTETFVKSLSAHFLMSVSPLRDSQGRVTGGVLVARDITAQKVAEARILRLNRLYAVLSETNKAIACATDRGALFRDACRIVVELGAFPLAWVGQLDGADRVRAVASHGVTGYLEGIEITVQTGEPLGQGPIGMIMRGEQILFVNNDFLQNTSTQPWHDRAAAFGLRASASIALQHRGSAVAVLSIYALEQDFFNDQLIELLQQLAADLSFALDNLDREQRLRESELKFRTLFEKSKDAIFILDPQGGLVDINAAGCEIFGSLEGIFPLEFTRRVGGQPETLRELLLTQDYVKDFETQLSRPGGHSCHLLVSASVVYNARREVTGFQGIIHDLTERKQLEQQLVQSQKMESIGLLAGGVAHDFNNILTAIVGYSQIIQHEFGALDNRLGLCIDQVLKASSRAVGLTRSLLTFSRKQIVTLQPVRINDIITELSKILVPIIGEDIEFRVELGQQSPTVLADSGQLDQVLINLATNARDAMPRGGKLLVRTERIELASAAALGIGLSRGGPFAAITVVDNGQGMQDEVQKRIFEPFYTTKESGKGTGLGLSIIYGIVKQHNGAITVASAPGRGTTFTIFLPVIEAAAGKLPAEAAQAALSGTETILLAEDDALVLSYQEEALATAGYTVITAQNGAEAVERFLIHQDRIDLVLCDVVMPKKNGREVYEEIRRIKPGIRFLFNSGYDDELIAAKGLRLAGIDYLAKPVPRLVLLAKLREMLDTAPFPGDHPEQVSSP